MLETLCFYQTLLWALIRSWEKWWTETLCFIPNPTHRFSELPSINRQIVITRKCHLWLFCKLRRVCSQIWQAYVTALLTSTCCMFTCAVINKFPIDQKAGGGYWAAEFSWLGLCCNCAAPAVCCQFAPMPTCGTDDIWVIRGYIWATGVFIWLAQPGWNLEFQNTQ